MFGLFQNSQLPAAISIQNQQLNYLTTTQWVTSSFPTTIITIYAKLTNYFMPITITTIRAGTIIVSVYKDRRILDP